MYPDLPPPTYNESVWGTANVRHSEEDEHTKGDWDFMQRYVTYNTITTFGDLLFHSLTNAK